MYHQRLGREVSSMVARVGDTMAHMTDKTTTSLVRPATYAVRVSVDEQDTLHSRVALSSAEAMLLQGVSVPTIELGVKLICQMIQELHPILLSSAQSALAIQAS
jgi:hypothetical protein